MKKNVIIVVLLLLLIGLGGYIGYDYLTYKKENKTPTEKVNDDKNNSINELKKLDDSKDLIYSNTETIGKLVAVVNEDYCFETKEEFENWIKLNPENSKTEIEGYKKDVSIIDNNANIILNYPTINIDNDTVSKLNKEIKDYINEGKENIKKGDNSHSLYGIKLIVDNAPKYNMGFYWNEVLTIESSNYISVIFKKLSLANCAGSGYNIDKIKYIDKETGLEVSEYDILAKYNYQNINDLKSNIKVDEEDSIDLSSIHSPYIDKNEKLHVFVTLNGDGEFIVENNEIELYEG